MTSQLPQFWCLFLSCQQQKQKRGICDVIKVFLISLRLQQKVKLLTPMTLQFASSSQPAFPTSCTAAFYVTIKSDQMDGGQLTGQTITRAVSISQITRRAFDVSRVTHLLDKLHTQVVHQGGIAKAFVCAGSQRQHAKVCIFHGVSV